MQNFLNQTWLERYQTNISEHVLTLLWSTIVAIFSVGGFIGVSIGGILSIKLGRYGANSFVKWSSFFSILYLYNKDSLCCRKGALLANNVFAIIASLLMGLSSPAGAFELLIIGRLLIGINAGK